MAEAWQRRAIEDVCVRVTSGGTPRRQRDGYYVAPEAGLPWVKTQELDDGWIDETSEWISERALAESSAKRLPPGTLLIAMYGATVGKLGLLRREMACNQASCALIVDSRLADNRYLFYALLAERPRLVALANGAAQQNLSGAIIRRFELSMPPLDEQRRIAGLLGALDDLIDTNTSTIASVENLLLARFAMHGFDEPGEMELSELVEINPRYAKPIGVSPYIDMAALPTRSYQIDTVSSRPAAGGARFARGDALLARITPCLENGKAAFASDAPDGEVLVGSTEFIVMRSLAGVPASWPYFLSRSDRFREYAIRHMSGSTGRQRLDASVLASYRLREPDSRALASFGEHAAGLIFAADQLKHENAQLRRTRDDLLPSILTGKVRVGDLLGADATGDK